MRRPVAVLAARAAILAVTLAAWEVAARPTGGADLIAQLRGPLPHLALHSATSLLDSIAGASRDHLCGLVHLLCDH